MDNYALGSVMSLVAYFLGSVSSAIIVCKMLNLPNPKEHGSKNAGATNTFRVLGKKARPEPYVL